MHDFHDDGSQPRKGEVFVFGSNLAGRHGAGAALAARERFGAVLGRGIGYMGQAPNRCYAIPTKDERLNVLPLDRIRQFVDEFRRFVESRPDLKFFVTRVGCGLAGYRDREIAPLFAGLPEERVSLPDNWRPYLNADRPVPHRNGEKNEGTHLV